MEVRILGPLEVEGVDKAALGGLRQQSVLVLLALNRNRWVSRDRIVAGVWDEPPSSAISTLQGYISHLRTALAATSVSLESRPNEYSMQTAELVLDAERFEAIFKDARRWLSEGGAPGLRSALASLASGLDLWRGPALEGFRDQPFAAPEASRLDLLRVRAQTDQLQIAIRLGEHSLVLPQLAAMVELEPFDEELRALQVVALYRSGRQVDALAAYRHYRRRLAHEMALEPGPQLRELERSVLKHGARLLSPSWSTLPALGDPATGGRRTAVADPEVPTRALPSWTTQFVGREAELTVLGDLLRTQRMVTITGVGGVGKTRLAVAAAEVELSSRSAVFVDLGQVTDPSRLLWAVAAAFQAQGPSVTPAELARALADEPTLVVLDGCEHLAVAVSALCDTLLQGSRKLRFLTTSRQPLEVEGERVMELAPMRLERAADGGPGRGDAVELFLARAQIEGESGGPSPPELSLISSICRRVDGLPLAIELAAVSARSLALSDLLERLESRISSLDVGVEEGGSSRRTLLGTLDWSYRLLTSEQQLVLRRLGVFRGPFDLAAVEAVLAGGFSPGEEVAGLLAQLVSRSLVVRRPGPTQRQYALLEATREFAHDRAAQSGELELARARHGALFLQFGLAAAAALDGPSAPRWTAQFELAESDIRAAIEQLRGEGRLEDAAVLELSLAAYALRRYRLAQIRERLGPLGVDPRLSALTRAEAFRRSGEAAMVADDFVAAASAFAAALEVATAAHLDQLVLRVRVHQAELMRAENAPEEQILTLLEAVLEEAAVGAVEAEGEALRLRAITHWDRGELQQARTDAERARRQAQRHGRVRSLADTQNTLSGILRDLGELDSAEELLEFAGAYFRAIDDPLESAYNDYSRARIALLKGELQMAVELGEESLRRFSLISEAWGAAMSQRLLGEAALALGQTVEAGRWLKSALGALEERAFTADIVGVSEALARLALSEGAPEQAVATARGALALIQPSQRSRYRAPLLTTLSRAELANGRPDAALEAAGAAVDAAGESGAVLPLAQAKQALPDCQKAAAAG